MKNVLTRKFHGIPYWTIGVLSIVVLYFGIAYLRNRSANAANNPAGQLSTDPSNYYPQSGSGGGGSGAFTFPQSLPNTIVGENTPPDTPPFTSPSPTPDSNTATSTNVVAAPLASAPITDTSITQPTFATTDNSSPQSFAATISGGQTNADLPPDDQLANLPGNAYVIGGPSQVQAPVMFGSIPFGTFTTTPTPPPPAPITQKILPEPLPTINRTGTAKAF